MAVLRVRRSSRLAILLSAAALAIVPTAAFAGTGQHGTLASFQQSVRADVVVQPFNGTPQNFFEPYIISGNGYACTVESPSGVRLNELGMGSLFDGDATLVTFTGRPVTAFAGTLRVLNEGLSPIGGTINIVLNTGESFTVTVPVGGTFFGITSSQPFTSLTMDSPLHSPPSSAATYEWIDDLSIGTSVTAAIAADQCGDAPTISPITAVQYPFDTTGAGAQAISGVCDGAIDTGSDVWFRFLSPVYASVTVNTCGCTFDSILRVFPSCPVGGSGAGQIACNDDFCTGGGSGFSRASQVSFRAEAGEDYLIRISGFNGASGSGNLAFSVVPDCAADFNHSGGPSSVQDIFDFLNAYFSGCP